jgi:hypothetical protein
MKRTHTMNNTAKAATAKTTTDQDIKLVNMTVPWAEELMKNNKGNRRIRKNHVRALALEILEGRWQKTPDAIGLRVDGRVGNGQHRLLALIEAGKVNPDIVLPMYLCTGITDDEFRRLDTGIKRSAADALTITPAVAADAALIAYIMGLDKYRRISIDIISSIVEPWVAVYDTLLNTYSKNVRGFANAAIRVGVGLRWSTEPDPLMKDYILSQYRALMAGDVVGMSRATRALWKRMVETGARFYGDRERRLTVAILTFRSFDPKARDVAALIRNREAAEADIRKAVTRFIPDIKKPTEVPPVDEAPEAKEMPKKRGRPRIDRGVDIHA